MKYEPRIRIAISTISHVIIGMVIVISIIPTFAP